MEKEPAKLNVISVNTSLFKSQNITSIKSPNETKIFKSPDTTRNFFSPQQDSSIVADFASLNISSNKTKAKEKERELRLAQKQKIKEQMD